MLFSFIVPVYNTSKYLDKCLESILCQKGADFEIVLVDDGSTDNSGELCDAYTEKYPDIIRAIHKENEGLLLTRRKGFKEAKGDWFINVDSDDYISSDLLYNVVKAIDQYHPDMVMYNFDYFTDIGEVSNSRLTIPDNSVFEDDAKQQVYAKRLLSDDFNNMWSKAVRRVIVDFDTDYSDCGIRNMCEDAVQVLPLFTNAHRIVYLSKPLYYYRKGQDNITSSRTYENWIASKTCFLITEEYLDIWDASDELRQKFYTNNVERLSNFLRWTFEQNEKNLPKTHFEILHEINNHPAFQRCIKMYNKAYSQTSYLKFCVPIILKYVQKESVNGLKQYFKIERFLKN